MKLYLIELTKEPSERKHISEKLLNILDKIGQKTINTYIEADDKNIATSIKYNDLLNVLSNKDASQILDNIDMQSGIVQRIKSLCNLLRKDDNIDTLEESLNFLNMDFEGHWIQSYGQKLSSWGTEKTNSFITFLYYLNEIELIDVAKIRDEQIESLTELANSILKIRYDIRENATQLKALIYPQRSRTDNKLYFDSYLKELDEVSSLISKLKQLLDEDSNKISILMFAESLIMHLGNIIRTASNFSYQIKSILSELKDAKQHIFESYQQEIDRINSKILAKKLIELENNDSGKRHQNYENDALWKIFIDRVRDDEDLKKCIEKNYHPTHLMTINEKELLNISNMIISKKTSLHVRFTEILTSCKDKENKADEINNLIEWTKKLIGIDEDE